MKNQFSGYVLAGGKSSRMKRDKGFLEIGEKTFLENAVEILEPNCERVKVVLNKSQTHFIEKLPDGILHIFDIYENRGALGGIHAALKDCQTKYAIILAVDLPFVTSEAIEKLTKIISSSNKFIAVVPRQIDDRLQPLCAVYNSRFCLPVLENLMDENDSASVRQFLESVFPRVVAQEKLSSDTTKNILQNINSLADFAKIEKQNSSNL